MPVCHNIVEAMSCGCVPILEYEYASLMNPKLENLKNSICYKGAGELLDRFSYAIDIDQNDWKRMSLEVEKLYQHGYTPSAVISNIIDSKILFLQAEQYSLSLLNI